MNVRKTIRKVGSSKGIIFSSEECKNYNINVDDIVDVELTKIKLEEIKNEQKKEKEKTK